MTATGTSCQHALVPAPARIHTYRPQALQSYELYKKQAESVNAKYERKEVG